MINIVGLLLDIVGVVILFFFGPPYLPTVSGTHEVLLCKSDNPDQENKDKKYAQISRIGLILILGGFIFQLIGTILNNCQNAY